MVLNENNRFYTPTLQVGKVSEQLEHHARKY